ncbi:MAG TPA: glycosyltransferase [Chlorobaculum sp.]|nr:glycosyltransferase [Chlorobaculum sp.]
MNQGRIVVDSNRKLSIAVPTYNRVDFIDSFMSELRLCAEQHFVNVYISDNASGDGSKEILDRYAQESPHVRYYRNGATIGPDENFERVLGYPDTDYVWLVGDTYKIAEPVFNAVMAALEEDDYDAVLVNVEDRVVDVPEQVYTDRNRLLADLGWHMTCIGSMVYSKRLLQHADYQRYRDTNFLQTGILLEYIADRPFRIKWIPKHSVMGLKVPGVQKSSWQEQTFEIWTKRWANFIFSLPASYDLDAKLKCIMDHGVKSRLFTLSALKRLRRKNILNKEAYSRYSRYFRFTVPIPSIVLRLLSILPKSMF